MEPKGIELVVSAMPGWPTISLARSSSRPAVAVRSGTRDLGAVDQRL
jgi:hypothetical protein